MSQWYQVVVTRDYPIEKFFDTDGFVGSVEREKAIILYFEKKDEVLAKLKGLEFSVISEGDWVENWRECFKPVKVGAFTIVPPWKKDSGNLVINPARGFGTGHHETTRIVLNILQECLKNDETVNTMLDVGTGSGILSIAASKVRPKLDITAIDNDGDAIENAFENLVLNDLVDKVTLSGDPVFKHERPFDLVAANIISSVLIAMSDDLKRLSAKWLVLSGILKSEAETFFKRMELDEFEVVSLVEKNEWLGYLLRRRKNG